MFKNAGSAEIIRSHQKDDLYLSYLRSSISDISQSILGPRRWLSWKKELDVGADLGYFLLTTFAGFQTVGEEYVNIIQVDPTRKSVPSLWRRSFMILFHVGTPYLLQRLLDWFERRLRSPRSHEIPEETRVFLLKCVPVVRNSVTFVHRLHLAAFYLRGLFYHIAKRAAGVQYLKYDIRRQAPDQTLQNSFRILGWLSIAQLCGSLGVKVYQFYMDQRKTKKAFSQSDGLVAEESLEDALMDPRRKCSLCLEERKSTTATPCGHLFCWHCIHEWCLNKPQCPLCREKLQPQLLVFLQNFDPP
ncbi:peroxisome biogenesis factor 10-like isoform X1 [Ylistrum balloti]|uniref:peroxisome biogenesis factor 10-like isoform X1 n=1 Tax=Ylistrum balloti TaxID=509963 RepID=UPI0029058661|nr:peroxisome biogenesis factor 10-like isoform X1 [Ylistrum balloti]